MSTTYSRVQIPTVGRLQETLIVRTIPVTTGPMTAMTATP